MAQTNIITRERRTLVGLESAFGTTPSGSFPNAMTEVVFLHEEMLVDGINVEMLDVMDQRVRRQDAIAPIQGLQIATKYAAKSYLKAIPTSAILTGGGTVTALSHRILFRHLLGSEHAALGTTVASGSSSTVFDVASASNLKKGTWILVDGEPALITDISAVSTVTVSPALSATPSGSDVVRNGLQLRARGVALRRSRFRPRSSAPPRRSSFTTASTAASSLNFQFGQLATLDIDGTAVKFTQGNQSVAVTSVTDDMSVPFTMKNATVLLSTSTLDRTSTLVRVGRDRHAEPVADGARARGRHHGQRRGQHRGRPARRRRSRFARASTRRTCRAFGSGHRVQLRDVDPLRQRVHAAVPRGGLQQRHAHRGCRSP
jgi:hypothetical protein